MAHPILSQIAVLLGQFLSIEFGTPQAIQSLGTVIQGNDPSHIVLKPRAAKADYIILQEETSEDARGFLSSIQFAWTTPVPIKKTEIEQEYGPGRLLKGLRPETQDTYMFAVRGRPLLGQILVSAEPQARDETLQVTSITLRRFAPEKYQSGRAVRFVVLADLKATGNLPDPWPRPAYVWKLADIDALIQRLQPAIHLDVQDRLGLTGARLGMDFRPDGMGAFHPNALVRHLPPLAALVNVREGVLALGRGEVTPEQLRGSLDLRGVPDRIRTSTEQLLAARQPQPDDLVHTIDRLLSAQMEAILSDPGFRDFQQAWLGLQYLADRMDLAGGSRLEVYSASPSDFVKVLTEGPLEDEMSHPTGAPPALIVLDGIYAPRAADIDLLGRLASESARVDVPILFGAASSGESMAPSGWARLTGQPFSKYLVGVYPRVLLRAGLEADPTLLRVFSYSPSGRDAGGTEVWGSAAWMLAGAAACNHADSGHLGAWEAGAPLPAALARLKLPQVLEPFPGGAQPVGTTAPLTRLRLDAETRLVFPEIPVRSLAHNPDPAEAPSVLLLKAPLLGTIRRIENQTPIEAESAGIRAELVSALRSRVPESEVEVEVEGTGAQRRLRVRLTPPFPVDGRTITIRFDSRWKAR